MARSKTTAGRRLPESEWRPYYLEPAGPIQWSDLFGNDRGVELEIGTGKGLFLLSAAAADRTRNFFGIELARKFAQFTAMRLADQAIGNARIAQADARRVLAEWVPEQSVVVIHVYFPDPWWKRKHKKRRIINDQSVADMARVLMPGGELRVASDVEEYFKAIEATVLRNSAFRATAPVPEQEQNFLTNFERKFRQAGKPIWRAHFHRTDER